MSRMSESGASETTEAAPRTTLAVERTGDSSAVRNTGEKVAFMVEVKALDAQGRRGQTREKAVFRSGGRRRGKRARLEPRVGFEPTCPCGS